ncbi:MAG: serine hydrolase, partial [Pseudomonadota bacterium]
EVLTLDSDLVDLGGIVFPAIDGSDLSVAAVINPEFTDGLVVLHRGVVVTEWYRDELASGQPHLLMSVSKSVTGSLAGIFIERGVFSPDDRVTDIVPEVAGSAYDDARVRHVLDMTVGMDYDEDYEDPDGDIAGLDMACGWRTVRSGAADNLRDYIGTMRKGGPHGHAFHYVSTNSDLLGWIIERTTGTDFATALSNEIWQPMGAEFDAYVTLDRLGAPQTDGGICMAPRDLARFGLLHMNEGRSLDRQIVPAHWIADFHRNGDTAVWDRGNFAADMPNHHYRSKWYTNLNDPHRPYNGAGIHGQFVYVDPVAEVVIAHLASHPVPVDGAYFGNIDLAFSAIAHHLHQNN